MSDGDASRAEADAEPTAEYESFDDFLGDDEEDDAEWVDGTRMRSNPAFSPPKPPPEPPRRRKRKKISFV